MSNIYREMILEPKDRIILALDNMGWGQVIGLMGDVGTDIGMAKANALADKRGWEQTVQTIADLGALTMADPKFEDVPSTMENHLMETTECAPSLITVHASNNLEALQSAVKGRDKGKENLTNIFHKLNRDEVGGILGVTVLTSIDEEECVSIYGDNPEKKVIQFAHMAAEAGLDGIVCSTKELKAIRAIPSFDDLITVVPGITPKWAAKPEDQKRISTPKEAIQDGADYLVIGRAITRYPDQKHEAAWRIANEIKEAL